MKNFGSIFFLFFFFSTGIVSSQKKKDSLRSPGDTLKKLPFAISNEKRLPEEELANKKEGLYVTGVPDLSSDPINGFGYGAEGSLFFNGKKSDPFFAYTAYRAELAIALFNTTKSQRELRLKLDVPYIFNTKWRLRTEAAYESDPNQLYFGKTEKQCLPGLSYYPDNNPLNPIVSNSSYDNYENSLGGNKIFYNTYTKKEAVLNVSMERSFMDGKMRALIGYEIADIRISSPLNDSSLLHKDFLSGKVIGFGNNIISLIQTGLSYDTRDLETDPSKGIFAEITAEISLKAIGSSNNFHKSFLHCNLYRPLFPKAVKRLLFCVGTGIGYTGGDAPFFEYPDCWGSEGDVDGLGGGKTLRGYKQARFAGRVIQFANFELRWRFMQFNVLKQNFAFSAVPFFDEGGVWDDLNRISHTENIRYSEGMGMRIVWNVNTVLRFDYAISKEDKQFFFGFGHTF